MPWTIEYFEKESGEQPAEVFEDALEASADRAERRISGKLMRIAEEVAAKGHRTGGGYVEKCHEAPDVWQMKAASGGRRGREFFAFDGNKVVLLGGVVKGAREATPRSAFEQASRHLAEYRRTRRVSPEEVSG